MAKFLSMTVIFEGSNLNYGESVRNIQALKRLSTKGKSYSYISRQALRYDMVKKLNEIYQIDESQTVDNKQDVVQFTRASSIRDFPEIDLFGYMKTGQKKGTEKEKKTFIRKAPVRLSDAVSLEPWNNDNDFGNNMGLAKRIGLEGNDLFQREIHLSNYSYTVTIELDRIGVEENTDKTKPVIDGKERSKRVNTLLEIIKLNNRGIVGRPGSQMPHFVIGGIYRTGTPFFYNILCVTFTGDDKVLLNTDKINAMLSFTAFEEKVIDLTMVGALAGEYANIDEIKTDNKMSIEEFFSNLKDRVSAYYGA